MHVVQCALQQSFVKLCGVVSWFGSKQVGRSALCKSCIAQSDSIDQPFAPQTHTCNQAPSSCRWVAMDAAWTKVCHHSQKRVSSILREARHQWFLNM
eukprot:363366-Chlamydomonas_euryale.AAC.11